MTNKLKIRDNIQFLNKIRLIIFESLPSTNRYLMENFSQASFSCPIVCIAEEQTAGQGTHGKRWSSPPNSHIYVSLHWSFPVPLARLNGLSFWVGIALAHLLKELDIPEIGLKWPNDVWVQGKKIAGILIEVARHQAESTTVVIGIGLNVNRPTDPPQIDQPWICLEDIKQSPLDRSLVLAQLLNQLIPRLERFPDTAFETIRKEWQSWDLLYGKPLELRGVQTYSGIARGIDEQGKLLLETPNGLLTFSSGEVKIQLMN